MYKMLQYGSRFIAWFLTPKTTNQPINQVDAVRFVLATAVGKIDTSVTDARKLFRVLKFVSEWQKLTQAKEPSILPLLLVAGRSAGYAGYYFFDPIVWAGKHGIVSVDIKKFAKLTSWSWFFGLIFSILYDFYHLTRSFSVIPPNKLLFNVGGNLVTLPATTPIPSITTPTPSTTTTITTTTTTATRSTTTTTPPSNSNPYNTLTTVVPTSVSLGGLSERQKTLILNHLRNFSDLEIASVQTGLNTQFSSTPLIGICGFVSALIGSYQVWKLL